MIGDARTPKIRCQTLCHEYRRQPVEVSIYSICNTRTDARYNSMDTGDRTTHGAITGCGPPIMSDFSSVLYLTLIVNKIFLMQSYLNSDLVICLQNGRGPYTDSARSDNLPVISVPNKNITLANIAISTV